MVRLNIRGGRFMRVFNWLKRKNKKPEKAREEKKPSAKQ